MVKSIKKIIKGATTRARWRQVEGYQTSLHHSLSTYSPQRHLLLRLRVIVATFIPCDLIAVLAEGLREGREGMG